MFHVLQSMNLQACLLQSSVALLLISLCILHFSIRTNCSLCHPFDDPDSNGKVPQFFCHASCCQIKSELLMHANSNTRKKIKPDNLWMPFNFYLFTVEKGEPTFSAPPHKVNYFVGCHSSCFVP